SARPRSGRRWRRAARRRGRRRRRRHRPGRAAGRVGPGGAAPGTRIRRSARPPAYRWGTTGMVGGEPERWAMQGVVKSYDPGTGEGVIVRDTDRSEYVLAAGALDGSIFRTLRQGQRVIFELDGSERATRLRTGAEPDLGMGSVQL